VARVTNGPTEALNNLIKRIKRIGFGFRNFENYRIRALL
jgi:transposase